MSFNNMNCLVHVIQEGDTLYGLSKRYNVALSLIFKMNPYVEIYNLQIGDKLCIPVWQARPPVNFETYLVEEGETLSSILNRFDINYEELVQFNNDEQMLDYELPPGMVIQTPIYR